MGKTQAARRQNTGKTYAKHTQDIAYPEKNTRANVPTAKHRQNTGRTQAKHT